MPDYWAVLSTMQKSSAEQCNFFKIVDLDRHPCPLNKHTLLLLFALTCMVSHAQKKLHLRAHIARAADSLAHIGEITLKDQQFYDPNAIILMDSAEISELVELSRHPHPVVRVQAWAGLLRRPDVTGTVVLNVARERWRDMDSVRFRSCHQYGSFVHYDRAGDYILKNIGEGPFGGSLGLQFQKRYQPDTRTKAQLDSLLLCDPPPFPEIQFNTFYFKKTRQDCYACVRQLVASGACPMASTYLAKFQREEDIDLILRHLPDTRLPNSYIKPRWTPFVVFRHPRLFQVLKDSVANNFSNIEFLRAVKGYANKEAVLLLDSIYTLTRSLPNNWSPISSLSRELYQDFDTVFADLYVKILTLEPENPNCRIPDALWQCRPDTLAALYEIWKQGGRDARQRAAAMFPQYEKWLFSKGTDRTVGLVMEQIKPGGNYRYFQKALAAILKTRGSPHFMEPLFELLEKEPLGENRFFVSKLLLDLHLPEVRPRLERLFAEKPALHPSLMDAEKAGPTYSDFLYHFANDSNK